MSKHEDHKEVRNETEVESNLSEQELRRRKFLKRAVLGTGIAATSPVWMRPVVNTVILPAHAQASTTTTGLPPVP